MGRVVETIINRFDGGMVNDPRSTSENVARVVTNFDILTDSHRMIPYRDSEDGNSDQANTKIQNFCIAIRTGTTYALYGLGVTSGGGIGEIYYKDLTTGSANDLDDAAWAETANNADGGGAVNFNLFVYYAKRDRIFFATAGTTIGSYDPDGSSAIDDESHALTYTNIAQGLVHSKDDILYVPYDNKIAKNDNNSWSDTALTLPSHLYITSISEYGNYLAIACAPLSGVGSSKVFLWDRDSSLATLSETIDWGEEKLQILEQVDGILIGVSLSGNNSTRFKDRIIFRYLSVTNAIKFAELLADVSSTTQLPIYKQRINNRVYFQLRLLLNGTQRDGVWSVGRNSPQSPFSIVHERTPNNDTATGGGDVLSGFFQVGDYLFQSSTSSSSYILRKTNDTVSHTATSIYESKIFNLGDSTVNKKLIGVSVMTEYLPASATVVLKYKKNEETTFTQIFTHTSTGSISHDAINIESSGATLPEYKEIQFRIESTVGAVITGLRFKSEIIDKGLY